MQRYIVPEAARTIRRKSYFTTSIGCRLIESATIAAKIVSTVSDSKHFAYIIGIAFVHKCHDQSLDQAPTFNRIPNSAQGGYLCMNFSKNQFNM